MQEDNEFRFQELEKRGEAGAAANKKTEATPPASNDTTASDATAPATDGSVGTMAPGESGAPATADSQDPALGAPPADLGNITVDQNGNIQGGTTGEPVDVLGGSGNSSGDTRVAALPARTIRTNSTAIPTNSSCRATTARRRQGSAITSRASRPIQRRPMRITGWANRCSASRNTAMPQKYSLRQTTTTRIRARRRTCC